MAFSRLGCQVFLPDLAVAVMLLATNGSRCDKVQTLPKNTVDDMNPALPIIRNVP